MYFYGYGILLTVISIGFYLNEMGNSTADTNFKKSLFKLIFSVFAGWFLIVTTTGLNLHMYTNSLIYNTIIFSSSVFAPLILHLGLQMIIYDKFNRFCT